MVDIFRYHYSHMDDVKLFPSFRVELEDIMATISEKGYGKVLLQGPEGLKRGLMGLAELIEERTSCSVWVDGEPCYGACDHAGERGEVLGVDALIHLGHSDIPSMERDRSVPIHFFRVEMRTERELLEGGIGRIISMAGSGKVALFTSIQHVRLLRDVEGRLVSAGVKVVKGGPGGREMHPGQVLGCSFFAARDLPKDVDMVLFLGTGKFHPLGLALATGRSVHTMDPVTGGTGTVTREELDRILRSRFAHINKFKQELSRGNKVGVVIGAKPGQRRSELAEELNGMLKERGMDSGLVVIDHLDPMKLRSLGMGLAVSTSCPRIAIDDGKRYSNEDIVLLTPVEMRIALDILSWSDYTFDEEW